MIANLAPYIRDLITAYETMPETPRRKRIIMKLKETYILATSDSLESVLDQKSTIDAPTRGDTEKEGMSHNMNDTYDGIERFKAAVRASNELPESPPRRTLNIAFEEAGQFTPEMTEAANKFRELDKKSVQEKDLPPNNHIIEIITAKRRK